VFVLPCPARNSFSAPLVTATQYVSPFPVGNAPDFLLKPSSITTVGSAMVGLHSDAVGLGSDGELLGDSSVVVGCDDPTFSASGSADPPPPHPTTPRDIERRMNAAALLLTMVSFRRARAADPGRSLTQWLLPR